ncbi:MAG: hypothetical protein QFX33_02235 [Candidatus Nezhaarchaeota archaeon]|nr:hypothetical protein [Candidatus Nezhaarchaeota archaeon]
MHVPITHVIGTAALILLTVSVALAYQVIVGYVEANVLQSQLSQVAEYASASVADLVGLTEFTYGVLSTGTVTKALRLPEDLSGKAYIVRLVEDQGVWYVEAKLVIRGDLSARAPLPLSSASTPVYVVTDPSEVQLSNVDVEVRGEVHGGDPNAVVWCEKVYRDGVERLYAGLGRLGG